MTPSLDVEGGLGVGKRTPDGATAAPPLPPNSLSALGDRRRRSIVRRRGNLVRRALLLADLAALVAAFAATEVIFGVGGASLDNRLAIRSEIVVFVATLPVWLLILKLYGLYRKDEQRTDHSTADDVVPLFHGVTVGLWLLQGAAWLSGLAQPKFLKLLTFWALSVALVTLGRVLARQLCRRSAAYIQNTVILGVDDVGQLIARKLVQHPEYGLNLLGFVHSESAGTEGPYASLPYLGAPGDLATIIRDRDVERVIVAGDARNDREIQTIHELKSTDVHIDIVPRLFEVIGPDVGLHKIEGIPLLGLSPTRLSRAALIGKRTMDIVGASIALLLTAPLFAWIAWRIRRDSPGPILFRQTRLGMNMRELTMLKFRTMHVGADEDSHRDYIGRIMDKRAATNANGLYKLDRPDEITSVGGWLRRTSLDELPQLINVLKGDMSLVGPRPCLPYEAFHFESHHYERFLMPAGMTGLWQVTARNRATFLEALEMDVAYARGWSLGLDLWLLARTPLQLLTRTRTT